MGGRILGTRCDFGPPSFEWRVNTPKKQRCLQELTIESQLTRGNRIIQFLSYVPEEPSTILQVLRSPKLLKNLGGAQSLGPRFFKPALLVPNPGLQLHRTALQVVGAVDRVRLGLFNVSLCVVEPAFAEKQHRQGTMNPKQEIVLIEKGRNSENDLEMVNRLLRLALGSIYHAKNTMRFVDQNLFAFWEETDRAGCSFFCGIKLIVLVQRQSELIKHHACFALLPSQP